MLPKNQHYVPQFLLSNFCSEGQSQIFAFDKHLRRIFKTNIRNVASETGFYNADVGDDEISIEPDLSNLETLAAKVIKKIISQESVGGLSNSERLILSMFVTAQLVRVKQTRITSKQVDDRIATTIRDMGFNPSNVDGFSIRTKDEIKRDSILNLKNLVSELTPYILDKAWLLFKAPKSELYYLSDNPVTMQNAYNFSPRGSLGLRVKGIEVYLPVSPRLALGFCCRSYEKMILDGYAKYDFLKSQGILHMVKAQPDTGEVLSHLYHGLVSGNAIPSRKENAINRNSLQVTHASRFVFSHVPNFELAMEMTGEDPALRRPPQILG